MLNKLKKCLLDERGYEMAELLVIVAVLGVIATGVLGAMQGNLTTAASNVGTKIQGILDSWTATAP